MRGFCVWRMCLQALRPAIAFSECVVDWSPTVQASALSDSKYHHFHVVISAKDSGDVLIRPHVYKFPLLVPSMLASLDARTKGSSVSEHTTAACRIFFHRDVGLWMFAACHCGWDQFRVQWLSHACTCGDSDRDDKEQTESPEDFLSVFFVCMRNCWSWHLVLMWWVMVQDGWLTTRSIHLLRMHSPTEKGVPPSTMCVAPRG